MATYSVNLNLAQLGLAPPVRLTRRALAELEKRECEAPYLVHGISDGGEIKAAKSATIDECSSDESYKAKRTVKRKLSKKRSRTTSRSSKDKNKRCKSRQDDDDDYEPRSIRGTIRRRRDDGKMEVVKQTEQNELASYKRISLVDRVDPLKRFPVQNRLKLFNNQRQSGKHTKKEENCIIEKSPNSLKRSRSSENEYKRPASTDSKTLPKPCTVAQSRTVNDDDCESETECQKNLKSFLDNVNFEDYLSEVIRRSFDDLYDYCDEHYPATKNQKRWYPTVEDLTTDNH